MKKTKRDTNQQDLCCQNFEVVNRVNETQLQVSEKNLEGKEFN